MKRSPTTLLTASAVIVLATAITCADTLVLDSASPTGPFSDSLLTDVPGGPAVLPRRGIARPHLGLLVGDEIDAVSDGRDAIHKEFHDGTRRLLFSVDRQSVGLAGTGVRAESINDTAPPAAMVPGQASDLFVWTGNPGVNVLAPAPFGWTAGSTTGDEANTGLLVPLDNVSGYDAATMRHGGVPVTPPPFPVFFSLAPGSSTLAAAGFDPGDVLAVGGPFGPAPVVFISAVTLGLPAGTNVDAISLEMGPPTAAAPGVPTVRMLEFSVDTASATGFLVDGLPVTSGAQVLVWDGAVTKIQNQPAELGLADTDELDGMEAFFRGSDIHFDGQVFDPIGDAQLVPDGDQQLVVARIGSSGLDGVSIPLDEVGRREIDFAPIALSEEGQRFEVSVRAGDRRNSMLVARYGLQHTGEQILVNNTDLGIVAAGTAYTALLDGEVVASGVVEHEAGEPFGSFETAFAEVSGLGIEVTLLEITLADAAKFRPIGGDAVDANQLVIAGAADLPALAAKGAGGSGLVGTELRGRDLDSFTILGSRPRFKRGDCNGDGQVQGITDALALLNYSFSGGVDLPCLAACDVNGDGSIAGVSDPVALLLFAFVGGSPPPPPFPGCGPGTLPGDAVLGCDTEPEACR